MDRERGEPARRGDLGLPRGGTKAAIGNQHQDQAVEDEVGAQAAGLLDAIDQAGDRAQQLTSSNPEKLCVLQAHGRCFTEALGGLTAAYTMPQQPQNRRGGRARSSGRLAGRGHQGFDP